MYFSNKPTYLRNMLTIQTTSATRSSSVITLKRISALTILLVFRLLIDPSMHCAPVLWNALPKELRLYNSGHLGNRSYCLLFYFTKSLNPNYLFSHSFPP